MVKKHPRLQLHQSTGKVKTIPQVNSSSASATSSSTESTLLTQDPNSEAAQKFELELCWCIQKLQYSLKHGKLNPKQVEESRKVLNTLMSTTAPIVKKRQQMRLTFGDYRAKMLAEEKKYQSHAGASKIKVQVAEPSKNSVFIKKSAFTTSSKDFKFNFPEPKNNEDMPNVAEISLNDNEADTNCKKGEVSQLESSEFHYAPSNNTFKFNFSLVTDS